MGLLGISLLVASAVYVVLFRPPWLSHQLLPWWKRLRAAAPAIAKTPEAEAEDADDAGPVSDHQQQGGPLRQRDGPGEKNRNGEMSPAGHRTTPSSPSADDDGNIVLSPPTIAEPALEEQTTPKAAPELPSFSVPSFTLSDADDHPTPTPAPVRAPQSSSASMMPPPPTFSLPPPPPPTLSMPPPPPPALSAPTPSTSMMPPPSNFMRPPPPPVPSRAPPAGRLPSLAQFPAANSAQRARGPVPNRGLSAPSSGLAPPPTHSAKPSKPRRKVLLTPGHSPLDWAHVSSGAADLRGLPASTPYLRVTPSMLKAQTGRKGKDAWMALNGKVYNVTPYADYHPGGVPELMRGAGRDATKLFGEIHPWVNYETMLSACLVGLLVEEKEGKESKMDQMD
ncbi:hypothetical protein G7046_g6803 [Stylonectria norvegica]|nr:hypothetical protein G7046_g6803 [Stylonectria norvegica]